jgi:hypothetical protein
MVAGETRVARSGKWQRQGRLPYGPPPYVALEMPVKNLATWNGSGSGGFWNADGYGDDAWSRYATGSIGPTSHVGYNGAQTGVQSTVTGTEAAWALGVPSIKCNILTIRPVNFAGIVAGTYNSAIDSLVDSFTDPNQELVINFWMEIDGYIRGRKATANNTAYLWDAAYGVTPTLSAGVNPSSQQMIDKAAEWRAAAIYFGDRVHARLAATSRPRTGRNSIRVSINTTQTAYEPDGAPTYGHGTTFPYNTHYWDGSTSGESGNMWGAIDLVTHNLYSGDGYVSSVGFSNGNVNDFQTVSQNYFEATAPVAAGKQCGILELGSVEAGFNGNANNSGWTLTKAQWIEAVMTYAIAKKYFVIGHYDYPNGTMWQYNTSAASMAALKANVARGRVTV